MTAAAYFKAYYLKNREKYLARAKRQREMMDPEKKKEYYKDYHKKNKDRAVQRTAKWRADNAERYAKYDAAYRLRIKDRRRAYMQQWSKQNRARKTAKEAAREANKRRACPQFAIAFFISEAYDLARRRTALTNVRWHVDHIVPLRGRLVSGLHTHNNVNVITAAANLAKGNRRWPDMP